MRHAVTVIKLVFCLALFPPGAAAFTQSPSDEGTAKPTVAPAAVAYVYVQTAKGVNLYDAATDGKLTLVNGSPFKTTGLIIGSSGEYFITIGTYDVHSYAIEPNGAIGEQVSVVDTRSYPGGECGIRDESGGPWGTAGAALDHTGKNLYVSLVDADCSSYQTFNIAKNSGQLTFNGDAVGSTTEWWGAPAITGGDKFAYDPNLLGREFPAFSAFVRESDGTLKTWAFSDTGPKTNQECQVFIPSLVAADLTNHLATFGQWYGPNNGSDCPYYSNQFVSYTVDEEGNVASTNHLQIMPIPGGEFPISLSISPSGKILAVLGGDRNELPVGLFLMHFNGAEQVTPYSGLLLSNGVSSTRWDNSNHLYAFSYYASELNVYTVTPTSISEAPGSPYAIQGVFGERTGYGLVVVPNP
jgi:hypothetical protein